MPDPVRIDTRTYRASSTVRLKIEGKDEVDASLRLLELPEERMSPVVTGGFAPGMHYRRTMAAHDELPADARQDALSELTGIRQSIDNIDAALIHMLAERFKFTQQVGRLKAASGMPASDRERERVQIGHLRALAEESRLDPAFAEKFLNFIVAEVIHHHEKIAGSESTPGVATFGGSGLVSPAAGGSAPGGSAPGGSAPGSPTTVDTTPAPPPAVHRPPDDFTLDDPAPDELNPGRHTPARPTRGPRPGPPTRSRPIS